MSQTKSIALGGYKVASIIDLLLALVFCATLGHPVFVHNLCSEGKIFLGCPKPVGVDGLRQHCHSVFLDPLSVIEQQVELLAADYREVTSV